MDYFTWSNFLINWKVSKILVNWLWKFWSTDKTQFRSSEFWSNDPLSDYSVQLTKYLKKRPCTLKYSRHGKNSSVNSSFVPLERNFVLSPSKTNLCYFILIYWFLPKKNLTLCLISPWIIHKHLSFRKNSGIVKHSEQ
jgi:hypothetical protein